MRTRFDNEIEGRFLSVDPFLQIKRVLARPQMWNRYAYVVDNPLRFTDPRGLYTCNGWESECAAFNRSILILKAATFEAARRGATGATALRDIMNFYGNANQPNGVQVEFGDAKGGAMATKLDQKTGNINITVDRTEFSGHSDNYFLNALQLTHEGQHGLDIRADPSIEDTHSLSRIIEYERHGYRAQAYINNALRVNDEYYNLWSIAYGFDPGQVGWWATQSALVDCGKSCLP